MTPAKFDTMRRFCGLSIKETADWCGTQRRTVERWISGYSLVSESAAARMGNLNLLINKAVIEAVKQANILAAQQGGSEIQLLRYRSQETVDNSPNASGLPLGAHSMLIARSLKALDDKGFNVVIEWGD
jgi:hypothetical protein